MRTYADQRADRANEILSQTGSLIPYFAILLGLTDGRNPKTAELLEAVQVIAGQSTMMLKHLFACRRPAELDTRVAPYITTPSHGSFPSGHATQAFAIAVVVEALMNSTPAHFGDLTKRVELVYRQAHRIAVNRTVAGVHYPMDSRAGAGLGMLIGRIMVQAMTGTAVAQVAIALDYDPNLKPKADFAFPEVQNLINTPSGTTVPVSPEPLLNWLWTEAAKEFVL